MAKENKTTENDRSVSEYLGQIKEEERRKDCAALIDLITDVTGLEAKMWGTAIVGFGSYHYQYESGRQGDAPLAGFAARVNALVLYLSLTQQQKEELLPQFGKHKTSKGCIYIQRLKDINEDILKQMIHCSVSNPDRTC